jgi:tRNA-dihydrouridine synthase B
MGPELPWLAPLAGYSDLPFRLLCREYGAACAVTEMVSAKGMVYHSPGAKDLLATCPEDSPLAVQLFGSEPEMFARAMDALLERGFQYFDLNCGCSVPKVAKTGSGSALLGAPDVLRAIVKTMTGRAGPGRVGVKLRMGLGDADYCVRELAPMLEGEGAAWLTLHPRHARQGYSGTAKWDEIAELVRRTTLPVLASGDLFTAGDARRCLAETGSTGVMFARGAMHDPAIFKRYLKAVATAASDSGASAPSGSDVARLIERHAALIREHGRPERALLRMRSIVPRYVKGLAGARQLRMEMASCTSWEHLADLTARVAQLPPAEDAGRDAQTTEHVDDRT